MEYEDLLDATEEILVQSTPEESPMTFSKQIIDHINFSSWRESETASKYSRYFVV